MSEPTGASKDNDPFAKAVSEVCKEFDRLNKEIDTLRRERDGYRKALGKYGIHDHSCPKTPRDEVQTMEVKFCTCGLDAALKGSEFPKPKVTKWLTHGFCKRHGEYETTGEICPKCEGEPG